MAISAMNFNGGVSWVLPLYSRRRPEMDRDELPPSAWLAGCGTE